MTTPQNDPSQQPYFGADGTQTGFGPVGYGTQGYPGAPGMPGPVAGSPMASAAYRRGRTQAITGAVLIAVGLLITIVTVGLAASNGGFYVVSYGPIIFGILRLVRGLTVMSRARKIGQ